ncbi:probable glycerol-3-phosphate acyltransferase 3 [Asparagus officinalis]|uniref:probable glycerol-3-phosphate acyltransferase 3 n=1 Tax=Asparagus officinalis TaxID=4686 RepID=UPI00098E7DA8|nr:probable glycerol-3-phosphate acyltransferase 3 [Asparagus officinalis]XP_020271814.1 probable glycerol-3-phosphate acyltransferase 3 [Asparagus officinalis]
MASKALTKSLLSFYRFIRRRHKSHTHASHIKLHKYSCHDKLVTKTLVFDVEGGLLRSSSLFPYFMLVALEGGGLIRGFLLLLLYPLLCCLGEESAIRAMVLVSFCGLKKDKFRVGRSVLPKYLIEELGFEGFDTMRRGKKRVCVSRMPRVMVEGFLKEYLEVEVVAARELKVVGGFYTGFMEEEKKALGLEELLGEEEGVDADAFGFGCYPKSLHPYLFSVCKDIYTADNITLWIKMLDN